MRTFWLSSLMLTTALGCGQNNSSPMSSNPPAAETAPVQETLPEGTILVTLSLPEMT